MSDETPNKPTPPAKSRVLGIALAVLGFAATLGVGFYAGQWIKDRWFVPSAEIKEGQRFLVSLRGDEPQIGPDDALVTIVEFSDFQCPYCARVTSPLKDGMSSHKGDVRLIFKHYPLAGHGNASPAAKAAWAAHQQGKFWEMHDKLFANQGKLDDESLVKYAEQLGLDLARFDTDRKSDAANKMMDSDHDSGNKAGLTGTPYFLVNGHPYSGSLPAKQWREIIAHEKNVAQALIDAGTPRAEVYATLMKDAKATRGGSRAPRPGEPEADKTYRVPVDARPQVGPDDALVTLVIFSDFQCPFCAKVNATIDRLKTTYAGDLRVLFRQRPLPSHPKARDGSAAALAAGRQGKFWEMHDRLFAKPTAMDKTSFMAHATELGLDTAMFELDLEAADIAQMIKDDETLANHLGVRGTPAFFINGRFLSGNMPYDDFAALVEEEKAKAQALVAAGTPRAQVYDKIMADALDKPGT